MTPVYLNPGPSSTSFPLVEMKEDQHLQLLLSPPDRHLPSVTTAPTSSFVAARDPRASTILGEPKQHLSQTFSCEGLQYYGRSSSGDHHQQPVSSSSFQPAAANDGHEFSPTEIVGSEDWEGRSCGGKWMPSKMRLMQKMVSSSGSSTTTGDDKPMKITLKIQDRRYHVNDMSTSSSSNYNFNTSPAIRVCSDCSTTTTPLWRTGPRGPKSLCNACGIRQRKAKRAAAAAAENGTTMTTEAPSSSKTNHKLQAHKEKKPRTGHNVGQPKKSCNKPPENTTHDQKIHKKLCFKKMAMSLSSSSAFQGVFSRDVEEAAILLMELSCGFLQS